MLTCWKLDIPTSWILESLPPVKDVEFAWGTGALSSDSALIFKSSSANCRYLVFNFVSLIESL